MRFSIWKLIWNLSEWTHIGLGRFGPFVFGKMIGRKGKLVAERKEFEMSEDDHAELLQACKPTVCMKIGNYMPPDPRQNANYAWQRLGKKLGFVWDTVRPVSGKSDRYFTAEKS